MAASLPVGNSLTRAEWRDWAVAIEARDKSVSSQLWQEYKFQVERICSLRGSLWLDDKLHQAASYCMQAAITAIKNRIQ